MKTILIAVLLCCFTVTGWAAEKESVPAYLQEISVTIKTPASEGSGVIKTREVNGKKVNFVWTAAHVVEGLRRQETIIDPKSGTPRQKVSFANAEIVKELVEEGKRVGELKMDCEVIRYSKTEDLAVLRVRKQDFVQASVTFYVDQAIPPIGSELYHVGSLLGQLGANSMTSGIVSQIGRMIDKEEFDQTTCTAFPGSSGGGVYLKDGKYIGCLVRGAGEGFNLMVPIRRMRKWAKAANIEWAIDDSASAPTEEQLKTIPVEDTGTNFTDKSLEKAYPFLIKYPEGRNDDGEER
jgi:hypothetical protein